MIVFVTCAGMLIGGSLSMAQGNGQTDGVGTSSGNIIFPLPGEAITDRQPYISIKLPKPDPPLDMSTIKLFLDGDEVTTETQVSLEYIFYMPQNPLSFGTHNVLATYQDTNGKTVVPLAWSFRLVKKIAPTVRKRAPVVRSNEVVTTGKYTANVKLIELNGAERYKANRSENEIKYQEGLDKTGSFDFTHRFYGKTLLGHYDRSVEQLTGRANDRFKFRYIDPYIARGNYDITFGDFQMSKRDFSESTIFGVQMRGLYLLRKYDRRGYNRFTFFTGRSQEPHDGRHKRYTTGFKLDRRFTPKLSAKLTALRSTERSLSSSTDNPIQDSLVSLSTVYILDKNLTWDSEIAVDNHREDAPSSQYDNGADLYLRSGINYRTGNFIFRGEHKSIGPRYTPTVLGRVVPDKKGNYGKVVFIRPSRKIALTTSYEKYHDNLHHDLPDNITDETRESISTAVLNYGNIFPRFNLRYSKYYTKSRERVQIPNTLRSESTTFMLTTTKRFHNTSAFTGTTVINTFSRYDIDRLVYGTSSSQNYMGRNDTRSWRFSTRYKSFANMSYSTSYNKAYAWSYSENSSGKSTSVTYGKSNTDSYSLQLNIIPFKFITNLNYRRTGKKVYSLESIEGAVLSGAPLEKQHTVTFLYYLNKADKLKLEIIDYDKQYRYIANKLGTYEEKTFELGYSTEF